MKNDSQSLLLKCPLIWMKDNDIDTKFPYVLLTTKVATLRLKKEVTPKGCQSLKKTWTIHYNMQKSYLQWKKTRRSDNTREHKNMYTREYNNILIPKQGYNITSRD